MAIFRAGKRIGPFDIRGGISRGDFKSSAYHKTDRDPRFKMQANVDNTIGRFRSAMASAEGYARPSSPMKGLLEARWGFCSSGGSFFRKSQKTSKIVQKI